MDCCNCFCTYDNAGPGDNHIVSEPSSSVLNRGSLAFSLVLGQILALCLSMTGITSQYLEQHDVFTPTTQSFCAYVCLALVYGIWLACQREENGIVKVFLGRGWKYFLLALIDVEANFLMVKAYQYTTLTSIQLLDCFTIPAVLVLSYAFLRARYQIIHIIGVALCLLGVGCIVWGDIQQGTGSLSGNRWVGDVLCLAGAVFYAISNVGEETLVKHYSRWEYLSMLGLFGSIISGIQLVALERKALSDVRWDKYEILLLYAGFTVSMFTFYSLVAVVISRTSAAFFNLSVLTADFYAMLAGIVLFKYQFHFLYIISFLFVIGGTVCYSFKPVQERSRGHGSHSESPEAKLSTILADSVGPQDDTVSISIDDQSLTATTKDYSPKTSNVYASAANTNYLSHQQQNDRTATLNQSHPHKHKHEPRNKEHVRMVKYCPKHGTVIVDGEGHFILET